MASSLTVLLYYTFMLLSGLNSFQGQRNSITFPHFCATKFAEYKAQSTSPCSKTFNCALPLPNASLQENTPTAECNHENFDNWTLQTEVKHSHLICRIKATLTICKFTNLTDLKRMSISTEKTQAFNFSKKCNNNNNNNNQPYCCAYNMRQLHLKRNALKALGNDWFCGFPNLESLDLSLNMISIIEENAFLSQTELKTLNLSGNQLKILPASAFRPLHSLISLDLSNNYLTGEVFASQRQVHFQNLQSTEIGHENTENFPSSLSQLNLKDNQIINLNKNALKRFKNLKILDVSFNKMNTVSDAVFECLIQLMDINLSNNHLNSLPFNVIYKNNQMRKLDLASNYFTTIPSLNSTSLESLTLNFNLLENITVSDKENVCQLKSLKYLSLSRNEITNITPRAFDCIDTSTTEVMPRSNYTKLSKHVPDESQILFLDMQWNYLKSFSFDDFSDQLLELNLQANHIKRLQCNSDIVNRPMALKRLDLSFNLLINLKDVTLPPNLEYLDLSFNQIEIFSFAKVAGTGAYAIPKHFQSINLSSNFICILCPIFHSFITSAIRFKVEVNHNPLSCACEVNLITQKFQNVFLTKDRLKFKKCRDVFETSAVKLIPPHRKHLFTCPNRDVSLECNSFSTYSSMCNLPCPKLCTCYVDQNFTTHFVNCSDQNLLNVPHYAVPSKLLLVLDFSSNHLKLLNSSTLASYRMASEVYLQHNELTDITPDALENIVHLKILDLTGNLLRELQAGVFIGSIHLSELYLSQNQLVQLPDSIFQRLTSLRVLQLHSNLLRNFSIWALQELPKLSLLSLSNNPWSCDCDYVERFRGYLHNFYELVADVNDLFCTRTSEPVTRFSLPSYNFSYCYDSLPVYIDRSGTAIWASVVAVAIFLSLALVLLFVYRREMQVVIYFNYGWRLFHRRQEPSEPKMYDAFLAHSSNDSEFVVRHLIPGLEKIENPYKLCVHERDFMAGAMITESIMAAVEYSHRTIIVLSQNFVDSGWCRFEFKSAHFKMLADRCNRIIIILLGDVPHNLDPEMKLYLKTNTYLKWNDRLFLAEALLCYAR